MTKRFTLFRWSAAVFVLLALAVNGAGLVNMQTKLDALSSTKRAGPIWIANQLEFEFIRFVQTLALFSSSSGTISADDVRFRFDILWSRHAIASAGQNGLPAAHETVEALVLSDLGAELRRQESLLTGLSSENDGPAQVLLEVFTPFEKRLHDYTLAAKEEQAKNDADARAELLFISRLIAFLGMALGLASLFLAVLFFADSRRHRRISLENSDLLEQTRAAYVAKSRFLSTVSHELRTPLTSIKGTLSLVSSGYLGEISDKMREMVGIAHQNSDRLMELINSILDVEKLDSVQLVCSFEQVDLSDIVRNAVAAHKDIEPKRNVFIRTTGTEHSALVDGDPSRLLQLVSNLLSNAIKFSYDNGTVVVSVESLDSTVRLSVQDNGIGIPTSFKDRVFEQFAQADSSDTREFGGTGLGLSIAKAIAESHGGRIYFQSKVDFGTKFFVEFPRASNFALVVDERNVA